MLFSGLHSVYSGAPGHTLYIVVEALAGATTGGILCPSNNFACPRNLNRRTHLRQNGMNTASLQSRERRTPQNVRESVEQAHAKTSFYIFLSAKH